MTNYKPYPNKKTLPSRMARKRGRSDVFRFNRSAAKLARKTARLARKEQE